MFFSLLKYFALFWSYNKQQCLDIVCLNKQKYVYNVWIRVIAASFISLASSYYLVNIIQGYLEKSRWQKVYFLVQKVAKPNFSTDVLSLIPWFMVIKIMFFVDGNHQNYTSCSYLCPNVQCIIYLFIECKYRNIFLKMYIWYGFPFKS